MATRRSNQQNKLTGVKIDKLPQRRAADYLSTYSNYVEVGSSPWDFRLLFFEVVEDETGEPIREKRVRVVMSPQHAMAYSQVLNEHIERWLKTHAPAAVDKLKLEKKTAENA